MRPLFQASTGSKRALCRLYGFSLLLAACTWEPSARPVQPEQVFEGPTRVEQQLGREGRYVLAQVGTVTPGSEEAAGLPPGSGALKHYRLVDTQSLTYCSLPPDYVPAGAALNPPSQRGSGGATLWLPVRTGNPSAPEGAALYFSDEKCTLKGPVGKVGRVSPLALRGDAREVALALHAGDLWLVDPWSDERRLIAREVESAVPVEADTTVPPQQRDPEALWLLEGPYLTQRALDGSLLLSLGQRRVEEYAAARFVDGLRVAFRDGDDVYEAKGPGFVPVLIAEGACRPAYRNGSLEVYLPCAAHQLVRREVLSGTVHTFPPGVSESFNVGDATFERRLDDRDYPLEAWVTPKGGARIPILPVPLGQPALLGGTQLVGVATDGRFGAWSLRSGFTTVLAGVRELRPFRSARTSELEWLVLHDVRDNLVGRISTFTQRDVERALAGVTAPGAPAAPLALRLLAEGVPRVGGFRINSGIGAEPVVLTLENATQLPDARFAGTLHARLLSGSLEARIDEGVSSNLLLVAPQPAVLYGISEGARNGLWFAAL